MLRGVFHAAAILTLMGAASASAQDRNQLISAFSGQWFLFDPAYRASPDSTCTLTLLQEGQTQPLAISDNDVGDRLPAQMTGCNWRLAPVTLWTVEEGVLRFYDQSLDLVAELGGNQRRITGTTAPEGDGIILERASGDGNAEAIALAMQRHRCYFRGFTDQCIDDDDRAAPQFDSDTGLAQVQLLVNLLVRSQPRRDSSSVGTLPQGTCIRVSQCIIASDGTWCRARFGDVIAWMPQVALRQQEWPIYTYRAGCPEAEEPAPNASPAQ